jgi:hypothetical protein
MTDDKRAEMQAVTQVEGIIEMTSPLLSDDSTDKEKEDAMQAIQEDPLGVAVRSGWVSDGDERMEPEEFQILLCTGGPAVRLIGSLRRGEPHDVYVEYQDWGTPWTSLNIRKHFGDKSKAAITAIEMYCSQFYFG